MKVKIDFYRKCFNCLYEPPIMQSLTWDNGFDEESDKDYVPKDEDVETMLSQLHLFRNIRCENCDTSDKLAFSVQYVNEKPFGEENVAETPEELSYPELEYEIHNFILENAKDGPLEFTLHNGETKVGEVDGITTSMTAGSKSYAVKVYKDVDPDEDEFLQENYGEAISYEYINLSDILYIDLWTTYQEMHWRD
ncbi:hypothetical protein [Pontibacter indicus]|uniref:Uncharacterized protein n=1 Tax=Pontibacter indicus TaxID=1317125 RepID=A0A1R3XS08_9BACT|nr:hypothetical protein [Pontibacter indicus]SIT94661.1 hypothetical protein SAMN05444128_3700 [Pontibacter indicus]